LFTVLFTFPSRYLSTIGLPVVFSLTGWCRQIQPGFLLSRPTQDTRQLSYPSLTGLSPPTVSLPRLFRSDMIVSRRSYYPAHAATCTVWANPLSLATTHGITVVFSSSAYLDVSVRQVCLHFWIPLTWWVAPFGNPRICPPCGSPWLIAAWHVLLRLWEPRHPPCALVHLLLTHNPLLLRLCAVFLLSVKG
jgi:hypothetical protein